MFFIKYFFSLSQKRVRQFTSEQKKINALRRRKRLETMTSPERKKFRDQQKKYTQQHLSSLTEEQKLEKKQKKAVLNKNVYQKQKMNGIFRNMLMNKYFFFIFFFAFSYLNI